ncbi:MAG: class I tRNA ligase family protein, partial [Alphaproteobacteria bacterium]|nr:class I tRNA ligase family protein [Alphaproteobacteria bacterium]
AVKEEGSNVWYTANPSRFLGEKYNPDEYEQAQDIIDVWFDSASSQSFVLKQREGMSWPADLYLEGSDQHRGWFQSSLMVGCGAFHGAPYKQVMTHGFIVDEEGKKMSKSEGNFLVVHDLIEEYPPEALRLVLLSAHYRQPFDFTREAVVAAKKTLDRYYGLLRDAPLTAEEKEAHADVPPGFLDALKDDLNTPKALAELAQLAKTFSTTDDGAKAQARAQLLAAGEMIGLLQQDPEAWFKGAGQAGANDDAAAIEELIEKRAEAKKAKDFKEADRIRDELAAQGILIEDSAQGTKWKRA